MMRQTPWVDRKFDFRFPLGLFPCILERVRGTPARLQETIASLPARILTVRVENAWSIQEHAGHLADLDELHDGRIDDFLAGKEILRAADMSNKKTETANHNAAAMPDLLSTFRTRRTAFVKRLELLDDSVLGRSALHPRLRQQMRLVDMVFFTAELDDHHLARIVALGNQLMR
jgi:uncharacterized damage-inducible protein DinB